jgi:hypothetical protein
MNWRGLAARAGAAGALMIGAVGLGWSAHPLFGLALGGMVYTAAIIGLRVFTAEELGRAVNLLPVRWRAPMRRALRAA